MTDTSKREEIEAERMDVPQMIARASYWRGWCIDHEIEDKELVRLRYLLDAVSLHLYDVRDGAVFEKAYAPTVDSQFYEGWSAARRAPCIRSVPGSVIPCCGVSDGGEATNHEIGRHDELR